MEENEDDVDGEVYQEKVRFSHERSFSKSPPFAKGAAT